MALNAILAELSGDDSFSLYYPCQVVLRGRILPESAQTLGWWPKLHKLSKILPTLVLLLSSQADTPAMSPVHPFGRTDCKLEEEAHTVGTHPIHAVTLRVTSLTAQVCQEIHLISHVPIQTMKKSHNS